MALKTEFASQKNPQSLIVMAWEASAKNSAARAYMSGLIDALSWASKLSETEYEAAYAKYVYGS